MSNLADTAMKYMQAIYEISYDINKVKPLLQRLKSEVSASSFMFRIFTRNSKDYAYGFHEGYDSTILEDYAEIFSKIDIISRHMLSTPNFKARSYDDLREMGVEYRDYYNHPFNQEFCLPQDKGYPLGASILVGGQHQATLGLQRRVGEMDYGKEDRQFLELILPHLQSALKLNTQFQSLNLQNSLLESTLNQIRSAVILVDQNKKIQFLNKQAEELFQHRKEVFCKENRVILKDALTNEQLQNYLSSNTPRGGLDLLIQSEEEMRQPLYLSCLPLHNHPFQLDFLTNKPGNIIFIHDQNQDYKGLSVENLAFLFQLTPAESRLAIALYQGQSLNEFALVKGISKETVRGQLKIIFLKTNCNKQSELIKLLCLLSLS